MVELTEEEAAIYDRQIRVWGADVQKRLTSARVLVLGCTPLSAEVLKNIVLAGVGHITIVDDTAISKVPVTFLSSASADPSAAAAKVFAANLQEMNPMVRVNAAAGLPAVTPDADTIKSFQLVLAFGLHAGQQHDLNMVCRSQNVRLMAAVSQGSGAYVFADLLEHAFQIDCEASDKLTAPHVFTYVPLKKAVTTPWNKVKYFRRANAFMGDWTVLSKFEIEHNRKATIDDFEALQQAGMQYMKDQDCLERLWDTARLKDFLANQAEFAPVNAVMGGFIGNDVVRCISQVGQPTMNVLFFSIADGKAHVHALTGSES